MGAGYHRDASVEETLRRLAGRLEYLERRVSRLESALHKLIESEFKWEELESSEELAEQAAPETGSARLEREVGEFGLGWVGVGVLALGAIFLVAYLLTTASVLFGTIAGTLAAAAFFIVGRAWRRTFPQLSQLVLASSFVMLFYTVVRTHYFVTTQLVPNRTLASILLVGVAVAWNALSVRWRSEWLGILSLLLLVLSALFVDSPPFTFFLFVAAAAFGVGYYLRLGWQAAYVASIVLVYIGHLTWFFNNPVLARPVQAVSEHHGSILFLMLYAAVFAVPGASYQDDRDEVIPALFGPILNGLGFSVLAILLALTFFRSNFGPVFLAQALFFLALSMILWVRTHRQFAPAFYACFGYLALTVAIVGFAQLPEAYLWLALQSLLVVSMALWFRSRILVVANTFIYLGILLAYIGQMKPNGMVSLTYVATALLSARVMNWQQRRLTLRTDLLRNLYLAAAFFTTLYGLYHGIPKQYVSLSWAGAAVFYFGMSLLLRNVKYRWMAILTMMCAIVYLLVVDLAHLSGIVRIIAFMVCGLISILISIYYARGRKALGGGR